MYFDIDRSVLEDYLKRRGDVPTINSLTPERIAEMLIAVDFSMVVHKIPPAHIQRLIDERLDKLREETERIKRESEQREVI